MRVRAGRVTFLHRFFFGGCEPAIGSRVVDHCVLLFLPI